MKQEFGWSVFGLINRDPLVFFLECPSRFAGDEALPPSPALPRGKVTRGHTHTPPRKFFTECFHYRWVPLHPNVLKSKSVFIRSILKTPSQSPQSYKFWTLNSKFPQIKGFYSVLFVRIKRDAPVFFKACARHTNAHSCLFQKTWYRISVKIQWKLFCSAIEIYRVYIFRTRPDDHAQTSLINFAQHYHVSGTSRIHNVHHNTAMDGSCNTCRKSSHSSISIILDLSWFVQGNINSGHNRQLM